jgi:hypothetical protein
MCGGHPPPRRRITPRKNHTEILGRDRGCRSVGEQHTVSPHNATLDGQQCPRWCHSQSY